MGSTSQRKMMGAVLLACITGLFWLLWSHTLELHEEHNSPHVQTQSNVHVLEQAQQRDELMDLLQQQNKTIVQLGELLNESLVHEVGAKHADKKDNSEAMQAAEIARLQGQVAALRANDAEETRKLKIEVAKLKSDANKRAITAATTSKISASNSNGHEQNPLVVATPSSEIERSCERRFGLSLLSMWKAKKQYWCGDEHSETSLVCYPYTQEHRHVNRQGGPDTICVATNFVVDFSKVSGDIAHSKLSNYLTYEKGILKGSCRKTQRYNPRWLGKHMQSLISNFEDGIATEGATDRVEDTPTYLLIRDEDCENSFHSTADFMNMFVAANVAGVDPKDQQVLLWDRHPDGPYLDLIQRAYAGGRVPQRHAAYSGQKVQFKQLVFHMESPAGLIFPKVANPTQLRCKGTGLFQAYAKHVLQSFDLWDVPPPPVPHITLLLRNRTAKKNVGRVLGNKEEVVKAIEATNMATYAVVDTAGMPYAEQLALVRRTNVLVGIHGAGLMLILFAANEAVLLEVHPSYRQDRHFRHASRMVGKDYMPVRAQKRETCVGSSDNVFVPMDEFHLALDGAMRLARGYDDGISECGALCNPGILALDRTLDAHYDATTRTQKTGPVNTRFPC